MTLPILGETLVSCSQAAHYLAGHRPELGKPHVATVWRWMSRGAHGATLESVLVGHTRWTSIEALNRFADALIAKQNPAGAHPATSESSRRREAARRRLARAGA